MGHLQDHRNRAPDGDLRASCRAGGGSGFRPRALGVSVVAAVGTVARRTQDRLRLRGGAGGRLRCGRRRGPACAAGAGDGGGPAGAACLGPQRRAGPNAGARARHAADAAAIGDASTGLLAVVRGCGHSAADPRPTSGHHRPRRKTGAPAVGLEPRHVARGRFVHRRRAMGRDTGQSVGDTAGERVGGAGHAARWGPGGALAGCRGAGAVDCRSGAGCCAALAGLARPDTAGVRRPCRACAARRPGGGPVVVARPTAAPPAGAGVVSGAAVLPTGVRSGPRRIPGHRPGRGAGRQHRRRHAASSVAVRCRSGVSQRLRDRQFGGGSERPRHRQRHPGCDGAQPPSPRSRGRRCGRPPQSAGAPGADHDPRRGIGRLPWPRLALGWRELSAVTGAQARGRIGERPLLHTAGGRRSSPYPHGGRHRRQGGGAAVARAAGGGDGVPGFDQLR